MRDFTSEEKFDISKFLDFQNDVYDVLGSPFLAQLKQLPIVEYYDVNNGFREIDLISSEKYGTPFFAYLIQFYNDDFRETFPEGTKLNLFSPEDLNQLYYNLSLRNNLETE
jgi:hypothetical protein